MVKYFYTLFPQFWFLTVSCWFGCDITDVCVLFSEFHVVGGKLPEQKNSRSENVSKSCDTQHKQICDVEPLNTFYPELYFFANSSSLAIFGDSKKKKNYEYPHFYLIYVYIYFLSHKCRELWQEVLVYHFHGCSLIIYEWRLQRA